MNSYQDGNSPIDLDPSVSMISSKNIIPWSFKRHGLMPIV